jgi:hypothetical protein
VRYNSFENIGTANVEGREGEQVSSTSGTDIAPSSASASTTRPATPSAGRLQALACSERADDAVMKTSLNLKPGDMTMMGAARDPQSTRA